MAHCSISTPDIQRGGKKLPLSDDFLVSAAQAGQEWAFAELCTRHSTRLLYRLCKITKNRADAEDALQESIANAFVHLGGFNRTSSFSTWLTRIGMNCALMMLRRRRSRPEVSMDAPVEGYEEASHWEIADFRATPEEHYLHGECETRMRNAVTALPQMYRHVFEMHQNLAGGVKEVAEKAGISTGAAKTRLLRARRALREALL